MPLKRNSSVYSSNQTLKVETIHKDKEVDATTTSIQTIDPQKHKFSHQCSNFDEVPSLFSV